MERPSIRWNRAAETFALTALLASFAGSAVAQAPATDIAIVSVHRIDGEPAVGGLHRVTDRERYDNQPSFLDEDTLVYTAMAADADSTDIWVYDVEGRSAEQMSSPGAFGTYPFVNRELGISGIIFTLTRMPVAENRELAILEAVRRAVEEAR